MLYLITSSDFISDHKTFNVAKDLPTLSQIPRTQKMFILHSIKNFKCLNLKILFGILYFSCIIETVLSIKVKFKLTKHYRCLPPPGFVQNESFYQKFVNSIIISPSPALQNSG